MVSARGPLLAGWILVRVGRLARTRRRYVSLRRDLVLELGNLHIRIVGGVVSPAPRERALRLRIRPHPQVRLVLDTQLQFAKWNDALQTAALWDLERFYAIAQPAPPLAHGRFSLVRSATVLPSRLRVGPCPAVYTPRLDHFFVPCATHPSFAPAEHNGDRTRTPQRKIRASVSDHGPVVFAQWDGDDDDLETLDTEDDAASANTAGFVAVTAIGSGYGDRAAMDAAPDSAGPRRGRNSFGSWRAVATAAARTLHTPVWRKGEETDGEGVRTDATVMPSNYSAAQLLRVQTGLSPALRASLEGTEYCGSQEVVIKSVAREGLGRAVAASEALVAHAHLRHHGLTRVLDVFETPQVLHSVMEALSGPTLEERLTEEGPLDSRSAARAFRTLLKAVGYLHACGIVHWDIRAANVVLQLGAAAQPKLLDFGSARPIDPYTGVLKDDDSVFTARRPLPCMFTAAPELLAAKGHLYAPKTDMWQMGCLLYRMLVGRPAFGPRPKDEEEDKLRTPNNVRQQSARVRRTIFEFSKLRSEARVQFLFKLEHTAGVQVDPNARLLISQLLTPNPRMRPNALHCLQISPFLQKMA